MCYPTKLLKKLKDLDTDNQLDFTQINKAIYWARKYHHGQVRKSGEPFYTHPLEVAYMLSDYKLKTDVIVTAILHDIVEDTEVTAGMILDNFSWRIAEMVDRLTRDRPDGSKLSVEEILNNAYEKDDKEVLLIKQFDRIHNINTLGVKSSKKIQATIKETLEVFLVFTMYQEIPKLIRNLTISCESHLGHNLSCQQPKIFFTDNFQLPFPVLKSDEYQT